MPRNFLNTKSWHPKTQENQAKLRLAEEQKEQAEEYQKELARIRAKERVLCEGEEFVAAGQSHRDSTPKKRDTDFMYEPPPGLAEAVAPKEKEPPDPKQLHVQAMRQQPFGKELRMVQCIRCGQWGHQLNDRECPMRDKVTTTEERRRRMEDPMTFLHLSEQMTEDKQWAVRTLEPPIDSTDPNQQYIESGGEEEDPAELLASLTKKQRKTLLKEFLKIEKAEKKKKKSTKRHHHSSSSSSSEGESKKRRHHHHHHRR